MTLTLYTNNSENIKVKKDLTQIIQLGGYLREPSSIMSPVITLQDIPMTDIIKANYAYIDDFQRYYFITDITSERENLVRVSMKCDVLMTYAEQILENTGVIARQENEWNLYLNDGIFKVYQNPIIKTQLFPQGFTDESYILAISGAGD